MRLLVVLAILVGATRAHAATLTGLVYSDTNGDGVPGADEPGVPNAIVAYGTQSFATTNAAGEFTLDVPSPATGIVWVRVPDGYRPGPVWAPANAAHLDLGLVPMPKVTAPFSFVVAADAHMAPSMPFTVAELAQITAAATASSNAAFFTIVGDITQGGTADEFAQVDQALAGLSVPYVPVPGNHDWYDGGVAYHAHYGPDNYSFDVGGVHFVVWNLTLPVDAVHAYLGAELSHVAPGMPIVALTHMPPPPAIIDELRDLGVTLLVTGHTHTNRVIDHDGVIELNTEPLQMGGLDFTPAGYRVITIGPTGVVQPEHHASVEPHLALVSPAPGQCADAGTEWVAAAELGAGATTVTASIDCGPPIALSQAGGMDWFLHAPVLAPGPHAITLDATNASGAHETVTAGVLACPAPPHLRPVAGADWPQPGGDATHAGVALTEIAPPLVPIWQESLGAQTVTAAPVIAQGRLFLTTIDLASGAGNLTALDLATGTVLWGAAGGGGAIRGGAAVLGNVVAVARVDGTVLGFDTATGAQRWSVDLGADLPGEQRSIYAAPAADGAGFVIGNQRALAAIAPDGTVQWQIDPVPNGVDSQSAAAVALGGGVALGAFNRGAGGLGAWDRTDGTELWRMPADVAVGVNASPVIGDDGAGGHVAYVVNGETEVHAVDVATGDERWHARLDPGGFDWGNATVGTPALAGDTLVVPTLYADLVALDTQTGMEKWRFSGAPSILRTTHYRGAGMAGFAASPVVTGDIVWAADTSGILYAIDLARGQLLWESPGGEPILAGLAVSGGWLVDVTFDGTVHAYAHTPVENPPILVDGCTATVEPGGGCCDSGAGARGPLLVALGVILVLRRRRAATR